MPDENTNRPAEPSQPVQPVIPAEPPPPPSDVRPEPIIHSEVVEKSLNPDRLVELEKGDSTKG